MSHDTKIFRLETEATDRQETCTKIYEVTLWLAGVELAPRELESDALCCLASQARDKALIKFVHSENNTLKCTIYREEALVV